MSEPRSVDPSGIEVVRSEERVVAGVERYAGDVVRVGKRIVTEERTVTVVVRREELYVERVPAAGGPATGLGATGAPHGREAVVTLTLSEEEPVVTTRVVPRERVRVFVDRTTTDVRLDEEVAREVVDVDVTQDDRGAGPLLG